MSGFEVAMNKFNGLSCLRYIPKDEPPCPGNLRNMLVEGEPIPWWVAALIHESDQNDPHIVDEAIQTDKYYENQWKNWDDFYKMWK